jgi:hypothetical protein
MCPASDPPINHALVIVAPIIAIAKMNVFICNSFAFPGNPQNR